MVGLKDAITAMTTNLTAQHGPDYVITKADVDACMANLRRDSSM